MEGADVGVQDTSDLMRHYVSLQMHDPAPIVRRRVLGMRSSSSVITVLIVVVLLFVM